MLGKRAQVGVGAQVAGELRTVSDRLRAQVVTRQQIELVEELPNGKPQILPASTRSETSLSVCRNAESGGGCAASHSLELEAGMT